MRNKSRFTDNEVSIMMHDNAAQSFRIIAEFTKKEKMSADRIINLLIEAADEHEAQSVVVKLRDDIKKY